VNNIAKLGVDLTLGLDSFMFFDDDPINIVSVSSMLPEVLAIRWPESQAEQANVLNHLWALDATSEYAYRYVLSTNGRWTLSVMFRN
jgi:predicted enzyme involved in methoxymalonyl-ACP biosynthesis